MKTIDIILLALVLIPALWQGLRKGFVFQLVTFGALLLGTWLSYCLGETVSAYLAKMMEADPVVLKILSFIVIFLIVYVVLYAIGKLLLKIIKVLLGEWVDKVLGIALALVKFTLLVGLAVLLLDTVNCKIGIVSQSMLDHSPVYSFLKEFASTVFPYIKGLIMKG